MGGAFAVVGGFLWWRQHVVAAAVGWSLGGLLVAVALVAPSLLGPVERGWMAMAHAISKVTTPIVMGIVYYFVLVPIGVLMRLSGRSPLVVREREQGFWIPRTEQDGTRGDMTRQF